MEPCAGLGGAGDQQGGLWCHCLSSFLCPGPREVTLFLGLSYSLLHQLAASGLTNAPIRQDAGGGGRGTVGGSWFPRPNPVQPQPRLPLRVLGLDPSILPARNPDSQASRPLGARVFCEEACLRGAPHLTQ